MRIVIIRLNTSDFGKIGTYNVQEVGLANSLIAKGYEVNVLFLHKNVKSIERDKNYNNVFYLPHKTFGLHGIFDVETLGDFAPNAIIMWSDNQLWAKNVILWANKNDVKIIQYFGGVLSDNPFWLNQLYTKLILIRNRASYKYSINVAKTNRVKLQMQKHGINCKKVIQIGLDKTLLASKVATDYSVRESLGYSQTDKIVLFVGRMDVEKKPFLACQILSKLVAGDENYKLIMIGKGVLSDEVDTYIEEHNLSDKIKHIKRVPYEKIAEYMVSSDCCINLSSIEIFGMTILEAMYYKLPVVAHTAPGPNDIITNGIDGYLCNSDDVDDWCNHVKRAIVEKQYIGKSSRETIQDRFTWEVVAKSFEEML